MPFPDNAPGAAPRGGRARRSPAPHAPRRRNVRAFALVCGFATLLMAAFARPAHAWDQWATEIISFSSEYETDANSARQVLFLPDVGHYSDNGFAWAPASQNGTQEHVTVGFPEPVYSEGVTIRETLGNGFVTRVDVLDTVGAYHQVWSGTDPSQPGEIVDFRISWPRTSYLVRGVRVYITTNSTTGWEEIDAIRLHGQAVGDYQWASRVLGFSSEYDLSPRDFSAAQMLGEPDVVGYGDDTRAWTASTRDETVEFVTLGFERPVYSTGVGIRETNANGFVRKVEVLDTSGTYHTVWEGTDPSQPGQPALFIATWPQTAYPVNGVRITLSTDHDPDNWEEIDAVYVRGATAATPAPVVTSVSPDTVFQQGPGFTLTVTGSSFLNTSVVRWNGADRPTTYVSPTRLTAEISTQDIAAPGTVDVTVSTPPPGGGVSNAVPFTVSDVYAQWASNVIAVTSQYGEIPNPYSASRAVGPPDVQEYGDDGNAWTARGIDIGLQSITLGYTRSVFATGVVVRESNANGFVRKIEALDMNGGVHTVWTGTDPTPPGQMADFRITFPQTAYAVRGLRVTIDTNHALDDWEQIDAVQLQGRLVTFPAPTITRLAPNPALRAGPGFTLVITGTGFAPASVVRWNGADRATTYVSGTTLTIPVSAADVAATGTASITVFTPEPGGGTSAAAVLNIGPARYGDVDGNDAINMADVSAALRVASGLNATTGLKGGDVAPSWPQSAAGYGDGRITLADALRIARFLREL